MIRRLVLKNWRSHEDSEFVFSRGTNVLIGRMGAGKSSVMDAISFALFGTFPNLQARRIKLDDCIMNKPTQKEKAKVEVEVELGGNIYRVSREITFGKGTTHAEVVKDGELLEGGNTSRVNDIVSNALGINYELFSRAIYSEQNQIDYFLQIPKGKRREKIDELLGIDKFEDARKNLMALKKRAKDRLGDKKSELESMEKEDVQKRVDQIKSDIKAMEDELETKRKELESVKTEYSLAKEKLEALEKAKLDIERMNNEKESLAGKLETLKERVRQYQDKYEKYLSMDLDTKLNTAKQKLSSIKTKKIELEKDLRDISDKIASLKAKLSRVEDLRKKLESSETELKSISERLARKEELMKNIEDVKREIEKVRQELAESEAGIKNLDERESKLSGAEGKCPVCGQPLETHKKEEIILHIQNEREELLLSVSKKKDTLKGLNNKLNELLKQQRELDMLEGKRNSIQREIESMKGELEEIKTVPGVLRELETKKPELEEQLKQIGEEYERLSSLVPKLERLLEIKKEVESGKMEIERIGKKIDSLVKSISEIKFDKEGYEKLKQSVLNLTSRVSRLESEIEGKAKLIAEKKKLADELTSRIEFMESVRNEIDVLDSIINSLDTLIVALETSQSALREEFIEAVNSALEDIWPRLYPYGDYTNLRLFVDGKDYILQLQRRDGNWVNVEGVVSGGERSSAALALRVAFALVLTQNLSWLILDEPTHNLDREGVQTLAKTLKEHLPSLVDQIFIITHDEDMEEAVSGTLYKLERDKGVDEPTRVILVSSGGA